MPVGDVASNVECSSKPGDHHTHNKEACEVYFIKVLRVQEEVGYAKVFTKIAGDHCKEYNPAEDEDLVALKIVEEQLYREGVEDRVSKF